MFAAETIVKIKDLLLVPSPTECDSFLVPILYFGRRLEMYHIALMREVYLPLLIY